MTYPVKIRFKQYNKLINKYKSKILHYSKKLKKIKYNNNTHDKKNFITNELILKNIRIYNNNNNNWFISFAAFMFCLPFNFDHSKISNDIKILCMNIFKNNDMSVIVNTIYKLYPYEVNIYLCEYLRIIKKNDYIKKIFFDKYI